MLAMIGSGWASARRAGAGGTATGVGAAVASPVAAEVELEIPFLQEEFLEPVLFEEAEEGFDLFLYVLFHGIPAERRL